MLINLKLLMFVIIFTEKQSYELALKSMFGFSWWSRTSKRKRLPKLFRLCSKYHNKNEHVFL